MIPINAQFDDKKFMREMQNIVDYSIGFLDGVHAAKPKFSAIFGESILEALKRFIDSNARVNPDALHHMYEWSKSGSPDARLFDINYIVTSRGLSFNSEFRQSTSVKSGSNVPFYDKARIMENGIPVRISPKRAESLAFDLDGKTVFTKREVIVDNPGGDVAGEYEKIFSSFFGRYFSQGFLASTGILNYISKPKAFKNNLRSGAKFGKSIGRSVGYDWLASAGVIE